MDPKLKRIIKEFYQRNFPKKKFIPGKTVIPPSGKVFDHREIERMVEAVFDGWWTEGRFTEAFENELARRLHRRYSVMVNSGSSANLLALSALTSFRLGKRRLRKGDEVITAAAGFPTTINPIIQNNLKPVFVDIDLETLNPNAEQIKKALSKKTKAIFLSHTLGNPFNLKEIRKICQEHQLWLIEDNCDALGSTYQKKPTGSFGDIATQSFYPAHQITTGEGGAVLTNSSLLNKIIRSLRDWGRDCWCRTGCDNTCGKRFSWRLGDLPAGYDHKYIYSEIGYNLKSTDLEAALGLVQIKKLNRFIQQRRSNFQFLYQRFRPLEKYFLLVQKEKFSQPNWFGFPLTLKDDCPFSREDLLRYLNKYQIGTRLLFGGNITKQPYFKNYALRFRKIGSLKNTDKVMKDTFWLGVYPGLNKTKLSFVVKKIKNFIGQASQ